MIRPETSPSSSSSSSILRSPTAMRTPTSEITSTPTTPSVTTTAPNRDAESLFRAKPISEIRSIESQTKTQIESKQQELRQLVGHSYRDLIESADSIIQMRSTCQTIHSNLSLIQSHLHSLNPQPPNPSPNPNPNPNRSKIYAVASRVKYIVDTPESIWGCLDESMLLEASGRYLRAKEVHGLVIAAGRADLDVMSKFPLLRHQWQIVESFKSQISQKSWERLTDRDLTVGAYADALAAVAMMDELRPEQVLGLFLDSRKSWVLQKLTVDGPSSSCEILCEVVKIVRGTLGQVGELFVLALSEMPLFYKLVLGTPPGSQLFGGIPNPEEEVRLWKSYREKLEAVMVSLEPEFVAGSCCEWLRGCCEEVFGVVNGKRLMDSIGNGEELSAVEKMVREALDARDGLEGSSEQWLRSVFGSEIESPWDQIRGIILKEGKDILEDKLEEAFVRRMKEIVWNGFDGLKKEINVRDSVEAIVADQNNVNDFRSYLKKASSGGGVWFSEPNHKKTPLGYSFKPTADENDFKNCLNAYFGPEVSRIRDAVDAKFGSILEDLLCFVESHNSTLRLKELAPYLQENCHGTVSVMLKEFEGEVERLSAALENHTGEGSSLPPSVLVERSLFIGRVLFALRNHSSQIPIILGSPRHWVKETSAVTFANLASPRSKQSKGSFDSPISFSPRRRTLDSPRSPRRQFLDSPRRQTISAAASLYTVDDKKSPKLEELYKTLQELCIKAHSLWIVWVSNELSIMLAKDLNKDDALSMSTPLRLYEAMSKISEIDCRLLGAALVVPVVNYWWPSFPANLSREAYRNMLVQDQRTLWIAHYAPSLFYAWMNQKWFPTLASISRTSVSISSIFSDEDVEIYSKRAAVLKKGQFVEKARQQGVYESIHRDIMVLCGNWEFDPMNMSNPFPKGEGSVHIWQGRNDKLVPVELQRYVAHKLPWIQYHEVPTGGHLFMFVESWANAIIKSLLIKQEPAATL